MNISNSKTFVALTAAILLSGTAVLHAQTNPQATKDLDAQDKVCKSGIYAPIVGSWRENLDVSGIGVAAGLVNIHLGGIITETASFDLPEMASPGYGIWQATDCQNYTVKFTKITYSATTRQFGSTVLRGTAVLSDDHNSFTGRLEQQFFNASGTVISSDVALVTGTRITMADDNDQQ